jgi:hypothetical protein
MAAVSVAASNFADKFDSKSEKIRRAVSEMRYTNVHHYQRRRHILFPTGHIDTQTHPTFRKDAHYKTLRSEHPDHTLYEFYVSFNDATYTRRVAVEEYLGLTFDSYLAHNTFVMVGTHQNAIDAEQHPDVFWVGAKDPLHKLATTLSNPDYIKSGTYEPNRLRVHMHSRCSESMIGPLVDELGHLLEENDLEHTIEVVRTIDDPYLVVTVPSEEDSRRAAFAIACHPTVRYIDHYPIIRGYNDLANSFVEVGGVPDTFPSSWGGNGLQYVANRSTSPLSFLTGSGYVIGTADTGIDWDNCFFYDGTNAVPFDQPLGNSNHRKIVYYNTTNGDNKDNEYHGTHQSCTVVGSEIWFDGTVSDTPMGTFNGLVPDAKIAFVDIMGPNMIYNVTDLAALYASTYGAACPESPCNQVNFYGWGSSADTLAYNQLDFVTDQFAQRNPYWVGLFATGDRLYFRYPRPVISPASAKSSIAVGSTYGIRQGSVRPQGRTGLEDDYLFNFFHSQICESFTNWWLDPAFCASFGLSAPCTSFQNTAVCPSFKNTSDCCNFAYFEPLCCDSYFQRYMNDSSFNPTAFMYFNEWTLDGQTNYGPLYDRRWGIDIATPGSFIVSAKSDQNTSSFNCGSSNNGYFVNNGTSMATAVAAGAAVKVIEYFANGYYPYGIKGPSITYLPFGIVVKALLLHAAQPLSQANGNQRQFYLDLSNEPVPNDYEGTGTPVLDSILYVADGTFANFSRRLAIIPDVSNNDPLHFYPSFGYLSDSGSYRVCIRADPFAQKFKATLVWADVPGTVGSALALVNNFDMIVISNDGTQTVTQGASFDAVNPYEQISWSSNGDISSPPANVSGCSQGVYKTVNCQFLYYSILINATKLVSNPRSIPFSLIVSAEQADGSPVQILDWSAPFQVVNDVPMACSNICPRGCSGYGVCLSSGFCQCNSGYGGLDCSLSLCTNDCNGNGVCDGETATCECSFNYIGTNCDVFDDTGEAVVIYVPTNCTCSSGGLSAGAVAGIAIGVFVLGLLLGFVIGGYAGIQWLVRRKKKKVAELKQKLAMKEQQGRGNAGVEPTGP